MEVQTQQEGNLGYAPHSVHNAPVISVKDWMITILLLAIPIVNIIMLFVWAFGGGNNPSKSNYAKASLLWIAIGMVLYFLLFLLLGAALFSSFS